MNDQDPKLSELLRRGPPSPQSLDQAHRAAVLAAARQAWFRSRSAQRRWWVTTAAAACIAAGVAGWALRAVSEGPGASRAPAPTVAIEIGTQRGAATPAPSPAAPAPADSRRRADTDSANAKLASPVVVGGEMDQAPSKPQPVQSMPKAAAEEAKPADEVGVRQEAVADAEVAKESAAPAPVPTRGRAVGGRDAPAERAATAAPAAAGAVAMDEPVPGRAKDDADRRSLAIPADAPQRPQLLAAAAILRTVRSDGVPHDDRNQALRVALDLIAPIRHPVADDLRRQIAAEMRR